MKFKYLDLLNQYLNAIIGTMVCQYFLQPLQIRMHSSMISISIPISNCFVYFLIVFSCFLKKSTYFMLPDQLSRYSVKKMININYVLNLHYYTKSTKHIYMYSQYGWRISFYIDTSETLFHKTSKKQKLTTVSR